MHEGAASGEPLRGHEEMMGYRMILAPYELHYHLSTCLDRCYLVENSELRAGLHEHTYVSRH